MTKLDEWMKLQETEPDMHKHLLGHLQNWRKDRRYHMGWAMSPLLIRAMRQQTEIGWYNFILGRHHLSFEAIQHAHYLENKSKRTGRRWAVALNKKLMEVAWDMWDHRNSILHHTSDNFHIKMVEVDVDLAIAREFRKGKRQVLKRDKELFKGKRRLRKQPLLDKQRWLAAVRGARIAWKAKQNAMPSLQPERDNMATWLGRTATTPPPPPPSQPKQPPRKEKPRLPQEQQALAQWLQQNPPSAQAPTLAAVKPPPRKPKQTFNQEKTAIDSWLVKKNPSPGSNPPKNK